MSYPFYCFYFHPIYIYSSMNKLITKILKYFYCFMMIFLQVDSKYILILDDYPIYIYSN